jgi:4-aminobutyrate aminotransferase-like enzyme
MAPDMYKVNNYIQYKGPFANHKDAAKMYADELQNVINYHTSGSIAGFIYEQCLGYGGIYPLPKGYITHCVKSVKEAED